MTDMQYDIDVKEIIVPTMLSIDESAKRSGLPAHFVRQLCITNQIVYVKAGTKYLVNFEKLIDFLNTGTQEQQTEKPLKYIKLGGLK